MRPYSRRNRRAFPNVDRALNQVARALAVRECSGCGHPVRVHAIEGGQRVCTRGYGRVACAYCAYNQAALSRFGQMAVDGILAGLQTAARWVPSELRFDRPVVLSDGGSTGTVT